MAQSEPPRKGCSVSADTSGDSIYATTGARFAAIHKALAEVGEKTVLPRNARRQVWDELERAREPVSSAEAKRLQIEASDGRPLTVCFGRRMRRIPELKQFVDTDVAHTPFGDGRGAIFTDSLNRFSRYCPDCRKKPGGRLRAEILSRCIAACEGRFFTHGGWRLTCRGCGERFVATVPQQRRCDRCRH
jgi:hypothetical protein